MSPERMPSLKYASALFLYKFTSVPYDSNRIKNRINTP
jgi:hypothetical protein